MIFPTKIIVTKLRPVIVMWSRTTKHVLILIELTVPWDDRIVEACERKMPTKIQISVVRLLTHMAIPGSERRNVLKKLEIALLRKNHPFISPDERFCIVIYHLIVNQMVSIEIPSPCGRKLTFYK